MAKTTDKIKEGIKDAAGAVKDAAEKVKDSAVRAVAKGKAKAARAADTVKDTTKRIVGYFGEFVGSPLGARASRPPGKRPRWPRFQAPKASAVKIAHYHEAGR